MKNDPLALPRFQPLLRALRSLPDAPAASPGFPARVLAAATNRGNDAFPLVDSLRHLPPAPSPSPDFLQRVLAAARTADRRARALRVRSLRILELAAVLAVLLAAALWRSPDSTISPAVALLPVPAPASVSPLDTLLRLQRSDGSWPASPSVAPDPAPTALAVLALLYESPHPLDTPAAPAIRAGLDAIVRAQHPDGSFSRGLPPTSAYLAIKALQTAARTPGAEAAWTRAARLAAPHLPPPAEMAAFNRLLAHPAADSSAWPSSSSPAAQAALALLRR